MAANPIQSPTHNTGTISRSIGKKAASVSETYAHNASDAPKKTSPKGDKLELSDKGRQLGEAAAFTKMLGAMPDVRPQAIENARKAIESGELFSPNAIKQAARNLKPFIDQAD
ncbi:MAG: flagellar biosynthesis anti-sigma factor FlgM [Planctomycetes bacterium]|nr:flagellar biosynthesis anti-sigma factor FlgM [Planctomycetota bacterium]